MTGDLSHLFLAYWVTTFYARQVVVSMFGIPSWASSAGAGFAVSVIVSVVLAKPSDREELLETVLDAHTLSAAVGVAIGIGLVDGVF